MKKLLSIMILSFFVCNITFANKNKNTWDYPLLDYTQEWVSKRFRKSLQISVKLKRR